MNFLRKTLIFAICNHVAILQPALTPHFTILSPEAKQNSREILIKMLADSGVLLLLKLRVFLALIVGRAFLMFGGSFPQLTPEQQRLVLEKFYNSKNATIRKGFWGLSTLAKLGVYGQSEIYPRIHYKIKEYAHGSRS